MGQDMTDAAALTSMPPCRPTAAEQPSAQAPTAPARSLEQLVGEHQGRVARLVYRLLGWDGDVDDVVQEVFLAALEHLPAFRGEARLETWLTAIAVNQCRRHQRRERLRRRLLRAGLFWWRPADQTAEEADADERRRQVRRAVRRLPAALREVVVLRYLEELPLAEVAEALGISRGAAAVRLHRARSRLADMLREQRP